MTEFNEFQQKVGQALPHWQPASLPAADLLTGQYGRLEVLRTEHAQALWHNLGRDNPGHSWTYLPYGPFVDLEAFSNWIQATQSLTDTKLYAIFMAENPTPVGIAAYLRIQPEHGSIEVGHLHYSKELQQTPAATEAMYLMMRYAFETLGYRRYEWKCNSLNQASRQAALRLGFQFEGLFRQSHVFKQRNRDTAWFSIIDHEWPTVKQRFIEWLKPDNFDGEGKQKRPLRDVAN